MSHSLDYNFVPVHQLGCPLVAFLIDDVQVNIPKACGHRELWYCPVGCKFTKPKAGLWWTLFLVLPFLCPLRCEVNSAHQREVPQRAHLMLLPPSQHTLTAPASQYMHTLGDAYTLHLKNLKNQSLFPSVGLSKESLLALTSVCPVGSGSLGVFPHLLWFGMKGKVWICYRKPLGATGGEIHHHPWACVCAGPEVSLNVSQYRCSRSLALSWQAWPVSHYSPQVNHIAISVSEAPCSLDDSPADWSNWTPVCGEITLHCFLYGT